MLWVVSGEQISNMCDNRNHIPLEALSQWPDGAKVIGQVRITKDQGGRSHRAVLLKWSDSEFNDERLAYFSVEDDSPGEYLGETFPCDSCGNSGLIDGIGGRQMPCGRCG